MGATVGTVSPLRPGAVAPKAKPWRTAGTVAVTADEAGRFTRFAISIQGLEWPRGTATVWQIGNDIAASRNRACEVMQGDWVWFVDDDHAFAPDVLLRLLDHGLPLVAPNVLRRQQPFASVACVDDAVLDLRTQPATGLVAVQHTGSSGLLIRREVIEVVEPPWFELGNGISEDVNFCRKAVAAGFDIHVDLGLRLGHITTTVIWPHHDGETWRTGLSVADGCEIML